MRPRRIVLVRHGEMEGNVDLQLFETEPDHAMCLTERGVAQARATGEKLRALFAGERVRAYVSPYRRARDTFREFNLGDLVERVQEEPRLREQEWGNYHHRERIAEQKEQRSQFGHFFYRMQHGESGADVYDRVSAFTDTLFRGFARENYPENALIVTHGMTMRIFMMRWFHWSVEYFESLDNPENCELKVLTDGPTGYELDVPFKQWREAKNDPLSNDR